MAEILFVKSGLNREVTYRDQRPFLWCTQRMDLRQKHWLSDELQPLYYGVTPVEADWAGTGHVVVAVSAIEARQCGLRAGVYGNPNVAPEDVLQQLSAG